MAGLVPKWKRLFAAAWRLAWTGYYVLPIVRPTAQHYYSRRMLFLWQNRSRCPVKGCDQPATKRHHVLYAKEHGRNLAKRLCGEHNARIAYWEARAARKQNFPLTAKQRCYFWLELVEGRLKAPQITRLERDSALPPLDNCPPTVVCS